MANTGKLLGFILVIIISNASFSVSGEIDTDENRRGDRETFTSKQYVLWTLHRSVSLYLGFAKQNEI